MVHRFSNSDYMTSRMSDRHCCALATSVFRSATMSSGACTNRISFDVDESPPLWAKLRQADLTPYNSLVPAFSITSAGPPDDRRSVSSADFAMITGQVLRLGI